MDNALECHRMVFVFALTLTWAPFLYLEHCVQIIIFHGLTRCHIHGVRLSVSNRAKPIELWWWMYGVRTTRELHSNINSNFTLHIQINDRQKQNKQPFIRQRWHKKMEMPKRFRRTKCTTTTTTTANLTTANGDDDANGYSHFERSTIQLPQQ